MGKGFDIGPRIGIEGEKEFREAIAKINSSHRTLVSELKAATSAYDRNDKSAENLTAQNKILTKQIDLQRERLAQLNPFVEKATQKYGENSEEVQRLQRSINNATAQLNKMERQLQENTSMLAEFDSGQHEAAQKAEELARAQAEAAKAVGDMSGQLENGAQSLQTVNRAALLTEAAVAGLAAASTSVGMSFEAQMSKVGAISNATAQEMEQLTAKAEEMGATTKFTATQAGQALEYMAMAGWKSGDMLAGLEGVMYLAAASGEDLGRVSDIVTDALTAFGLSAADSGRFADVLSAAASNSNTNVSMMGETFKYVAPVAGALKYSVEDVAVAIGLMANAGIKGETAGTALRGMLTNLAKPTDQVAGYIEKLGISLTDSTGAILPFDQLIGDLRGSFAKLTDAQKAEYAAGIAGKEAMSGLLAVVNASDDDFAKLTKAIDNSSGSAKEMAETMEDNLKGSLTLLSSAAEGAGIAFYDKFSEPANDAIKDLARGVSKFTQDLQAGKLDGWIDGLAAAAGAAGVAIVAMNGAMAVKDVSNFVRAVNGGIEAMKSYKAATIAGTTAQKALNLAQSLSPMGMLAVAAAAVVTGLAIYQTKIGAATSETALLQSKVKDLTKEYKDHKQQMEDIEGARDKALEQSLSQINHTESLVDELRTLRDETGKVKDGEQDRARLLTTMINEVMPDTVQWIEEEGQAYLTVAENIDTLLRKQRLKAWLDANQAGYQESIDGYNELVSAIAETDGALVSAKAQLEKFEDAWRNAYAAGDESLMVVAKGEADKARDAVIELQSQYDGYTQDFATMSQLRQEYESAEAALFSDDATKISAALENREMELKRFTGINQEELNKQAADTMAQYEWLLSESKKNGSLVTEAQVEAALKRASEAKRIADQGVRETGAALDATLALVKSKTTAVVAVVKDATQKGLEALYVADKTREAGGYFADGYAAGILNGAPAATRAAATMAKQALEALKEAQDSHSPSVESMLLGTFFGMGYTAGIIRSTPAVKSAAVDMAQIALGAAVATPMGYAIGTAISNGMEESKSTVAKTTRSITAQLIAEEERLQSELETIEFNGVKRREKESLEQHEKSLAEKYDKLAKAEVKDKQKILDEISKLQLDREKALNQQSENALKTSLQNQLQVVKNYQQEYEKAMQSVQNAQGDMEKKLQEFGELFSKTKTEFGEKFELRDLEPDILQIEAYGKALEDLKGKGIPEGLLDEVQGMSVEDGLKYAQTLIGMTEEQYAKYIDTWQRKQEAAAKVAQQFYAQELANLKAEFVDKLPKELGGIKDDLRILGKESGQELADGFWSQKNYIVSTFISVMQSAAAAAKNAAGMWSGSAEQSGSGGPMVMAARQMQPEAQPIPEIAPMALNWEPPDLGIVGRLRQVARQINDSIPVPRTPAPAKVMESGVNGIVNGLIPLLAKGGNNASPVTVQLNLDGRQIARAVYDPLKDEQNRRGE